MFLSILEQLPRVAIVRSLSVKSNTCFWMSLSINGVAGKTRRSVPAFADFMEIEIEKRLAILAPYCLVREEVECNTVAVLYERRSVFACVHSLQTLPSVAGNRDVFAGILIVPVTSAPIMPIHLEIFSEL